MRVRVAIVSGILAVLALGAMGGASAREAPPTPTGGAPPPVFNESLNAGLRSGTVLFRPKGEAKFRQLEGIESIPLGSSVDSTNGVMWLQSQLEDGTYESIDYYDGRFRADQKATGLVTIELQGADFRSCGGKSTRGKGGSKKQLAKLWGKGRGRTKTKGRGGSGSVRGTTWLTKERCDGTLFKVAEGIIKVRDFGRDKNVILEAGEKYLAKTG